MASFEDLMKALSPVDSGTHVCEVASSTRMNAMMEAIKMLIRGENIMEGPNIRKDTSQGKLILSADPSGRSAGGSSGFPFKVITGTLETSIGIGLSPGRVCLVTPTIGGLPLTNTPPPLFAPGTGDFSIFLRVAIDQTDEEDNHRSGVSGVTVVTDNDAGVTGDIGDDGEVTELLVHWTNTPKSIGYFYVKVADASYAVPTGSPPGTPPAFTVESQVLRVNIETIVVAGDDAIILATV